MIEKHWELPYYQTTIVNDDEPYLISVLVKIEELTFRKIDSFSIKHSRLFHPRSDLSGFG